MKKGIKAIQDSNFPYSITRLNDILEISKDTIFDFFDKFPNFFQESQNLKNFDNILNNYTIIEELLKK